MQRHDPFTLVTVTAEWREPRFGLTLGGEPLLVAGIAVLLVAVVVLLIGWRSLARRAPRTRRTTTRMTMIGLALMCVLLLIAGAVVVGSRGGAFTQGSVVAETDQEQYVIAAGTIESAERTGDGSVDVRLAEDDSVLLQFSIMDRFDPPELVGAEGRSLTATCTGTEEDEGVLHCDFTTPHQRETALRSLFQNRDDKVLDGKRPPADDIVITTQPYTASD